MSDLTPLSQALTDTSLASQSLSAFITDSFTHRWIRDMAWALLTPPFFSQWPDRDDGTHVFDQEALQPIWQDKSLIDWLCCVDQNIDRLADHMKDQRATRLGIYFEQLLSFYFSDFPRFRLLAKNLQANDAKRTVGEYDFIVWDRHDQQHYHIEVAVKFFVGWPQYADETTIANNTPIYNWHQWIGPNKRDSLGIKVRHLMQHQLRLSETDAGKAALARIGLTPDQIKPKLLLTGRLYLPCPQRTTEETSDISLPEYGAYQTPLAQYWLDRQTVLSTPYGLPSHSHDPSDSNRDSHYTILPRPLWMSTLTAADIDEHSLPLFSEHSLLRHLNTLPITSFPLHIAQLNLQHNTCIEIQRFFIL